MSPSKTFSRSSGLPIEEEAGRVYDSEGMEDTKKIKSSKSID